MPELSFEWFSDPQAWGALLTLSLLEIVLGIDNIVFLSILVDRLPEQQRKAARLMGLGLAMFARLALLFSITWIMGLTICRSSFGTSARSTKNTTGSSASR